MKNLPFERQTDKSSDMGTYRAAIAAKNNVAHLTLTHFENIINCIKQSTY